MNFGFIDIEALAGMAIGFGLVVVLPIVGLLLSHQRKMAELVHGKVNQNSDARLGHMQAQIDELRGRTVDQALALEEYRRVLPLATSERPPRRVEI